MTTLKSVVRVGGQVISNNDPDMEIVLDSHEGVQIQSIQDDSITYEFKGIVSEDQLFDLNLTFTYQNKYRIVVPCNFKHTVIVIDYEVRSIGLTVKVWDSGDITPFQVWYEDQDITDQLIDLHRGIDPTSTVVNYSNAPGTPEELGKHWYIVYDTGVLPSKVSVPYTFKLPASIDPDQEVRTVQGDFDIEPYDDVGIRVWYAGEDPFHITKGTTKDLVLGVWFRGYYSPSAAVTFIRDKSSLVPFSVSSHSATGPDAYTLVMKAPTSVGLNDISLYLGTTASGTVGYNVAFADIHTSTVEPGIAVKYPPMVITGDVGSEHEVTLIMTSNSEETSNTEFTFTPTSGELEFVSSTATTVTWKIVKPNTTGSGVPFDSTVTVTKGAYSTTYIQPVVVYSDSVIVSTPLAQEVRIYEKGTGNPFVVDMDGEDVTPDITNVQIKSNEYVTKTADGWEVIHALPELHVANVVYTFDIMTPKGLRSEEVTVPFTIDPWDGSSLVLTYQGPAIEGRESFVGIYPIELEFKGVPIVPNDPRLTYSIRAPSTERMEIQGTDEYGILFRLSGYECPGETIMVHDIVDIAYKDDDTGEVGSTPVTVDINYMTPPVDIGNVRDMTVKVFDTIHLNPVMIVGDYDLTFTWIGLRVLGDNQYIRAKGKELFVKTGKDVEFTEPLVLEFIGECGDHTWTQEHTINLTIEAWDGTELTGTVTPTSVKGIAGDIGELLVTLSFRGEDVTETAELGSLTPIPGFLYIGIKEYRDGKYVIPWSATGDGIGDLNLIMGSTNPSVGSRTVTLGVNFEMEKKFAIYVTQEEFTIEPASDKNYFFSLNDQNGAPITDATVVSNSVVEKPAYQFILSGYSNGLYKKPNDIPGRYFVVMKGGYGYGTVDFNLSVAVPGKTTDYPLKPLHYTALGSPVKFTPETRVINSDINEITVVNFTLTQDRWAQPNFPLVGDAGLQFVPTMVGVQEPVHYLGTPGKFSMSFRGRGDNGDLEIGGYFYDDTSGLVGQRFEWTDTFEVKHVVKLLATTTQSAMIGYKGSYKAIGLTFTYDGDVLPTDDPELTIVSQSPDVAIVKSRTANTFTLELTKDVTKQTEEDEIVLLATYRGVTTEIPFAIVTNTTEPPPSFFITGDISGLSGDKGPAPILITEGLDYVTSRAYNYSLTGADNVTIDNDTGEWTIGEVPEAGIILSAFLKVYIVSGGIEFWFNEPVTITLGGNETPIVIYDDSQMFLDIWDIKTMPFRVEYKGLDYINNVTYVTFTNEDPMDQWGFGIWRFFNLGAVATENNEDYPMVKKIEVEFTVSINNVSHTVNAPFTVIINPGVLTPWKVTAPKSIELKVGEVVPVTTFVAFQAQDRTVDKDWVDSITYPEDLIHVGENPTREEDVFGYQSGWTLQVTGLKAGTGKYVAEYRYPGSKDFDPTYYTTFTIDIIVTE